ncbi:MAG TPA: hypothetical protein VEA78_05290, partial [Acidimicrobiales bacterium]|nr:hypothetical protein [Acidimicrobiales bacterium]
MARRLVLPVAVALLAPLLLGACRDDTVRLSFRPDVGDVYRYEVTVRSRSEVHLPGADPEVRTEEVVLQSEQTVLEADEDGVRVQVILGDATGSVRTFVVRFDRAAQLEAVEADDALLDASDGADQFGISEIFPGASGAPPDRRLAPGDTWTIDESIALPGVVGRSLLDGAGRLTELGVLDGRDVARVVTTSTLQLATESVSVDGETLRLDGAQQTTQRAAHDLADGAIRSASSSTRGVYDLEIRPPLGRLGEPVE